MIWRSSIFLCRKIRWDFLFCALRLYFMSVNRVPSRAETSTHLNTVHHYIAAGLYSVPGPAHRTGSVCFIVGIAWQSVRRIALV
jgi:hypothetical protein